MTKGVSYSREVQHSVEAFLLVLFLPSS